VNTRSGPEAEAEDQCEPASLTLADVLYADPARTRVPEAEWVGLIRSVAAGDQLALHELYQRSHRIVFTLIMRITRSRESAEELTLDVFHDVWRRASRYDPDGGTVVGWLMNQARSRAIDRVRFEQRQKRVNPYPDASMLEAAVGGCDEASEPEEQRRALQDALRDLPAPERQAIESAFLRELTYAEVATHLNQPLGTIKTRIRSGLAKLRHSFALRAKQA
jgi:RNA polymerase sigma-70 factor, ECF subfamily